MRERRFDVRSLLEEPAGWTLPADLIKEWWEADWDSLSRGERNVFLCSLYLVEVACNSHEAWYRSDISDRAEETPAALVALGMADCASVCRRSLVAWADGEMLGLCDLDDEIDDAGEREDDFEHALLYMAANSAEFGIPADEVPEPEEVVRRLREVRERDRTERREREARELAALDLPRGPVAESDEFRPGMARVLAAGVPAVALLTGAILLRGEGLAFLRALGFVAGLVLLVVAVQRHRLRVRMGPDGIFVSGRPAVLWSAVTGCRILRYALGSAGGFEIEVVEGAGATRHVRVPPGIDRFREAFRMFLELTVRHDAPWSAAEALRGMEPPRDAGTN